MNGTDPAATGIDIAFTLNGEPVALRVAGFETLLWVLREQLGLRGAKDACLQGECGACTVLFDGMPVCSCLVLAADADGAAVTTVEGLGTSHRPSDVQQALVEDAAVQCGYCTPGLVVAITHLLATHEEPSRDDIREALAGNLCRCTGYGAIVRAVERLAGVDVAAGRDSEEGP